MKLFGLRENCCNNHKKRRRFTHELRTLAGQCSRLSLNIFSCPQQAPLHLIHSILCLIYWPFLRSSGSSSIPAVLWHIPGATHHGWKGSRKTTVVWIMIGSNSVPILLAPPITVSRATRNPILIDDGPQAKALPVVNFKTAASSTCSGGTFNSLPIHSIWVKPVVNFPPVGQTAHAPSRCRGHTVPLMAVWAAN